MSGEWEWCVTVAAVTSQPQKPDVIRDWGATALEWRGVESYVFFSVNTLKLDTTSNNNKPNTAEANLSTDICLWLVCHSHSCHEEVPVVGQNPWCMGRSGL